MVKGSANVRCHTLEKVASAFIVYNQGTPTQLRGPLPDEQHSLHSEADMLILTLLVS